MLLQGPSLANPPAVQIGLKHMKANNYGIAARYFYKRICKSPNDPIARYHFANCLVHLNRHEQAITEYKRSYSIDPNSLVSGYCKQALIAYKVALPAAAVSNVRKSYQRLPQEASDAVELIRHQVANEKSRHHKYAKSLSENVDKAGEYRIKKIKELAEHNIKMLYKYGPLVKVGTGLRRTGKSYQAMAPYQRLEVDREVAEIRRQCEEDIKKEKAVAVKRSKTLDKWREARKDRLDNVAKNLESQFSLKSNPSGIELKPEGTGLYVRNYKSSKTKRNIPDARYSVARIVDKLEEEKDTQPIVDDDLDKRVNKHVDGSIISNLVEPIQ